MSRRSYLWAAGLGLSAAAVLFIFRDSFGQQAAGPEANLKDSLARADDRKKAEQGKPDAARVDQPARGEPAQTLGTQQLPIGQVVLFGSGVGYFQREGTVDGTARVDLSFPVTDINDLLKSMVLRDLDGGHISTVSYHSNPPVERTLKSFAINLTGNPGFVQIPNQAR